MKPNKLAYWLFFLLCQVSGQPPALPGLLPPGGQPVPGVEQSQRALGVSGVWARRLRARSRGGTAVTLCFSFVFERSFNQFFFFLVCVQMCFEWFTKGQHDLESDVQQQLFKEKILKLEPYEITMNGKCTENQIGRISVQFFS